MSTLKDDFFVFLLVIYHLLIYTDIIRKGDIYVRTRIQCYFFKKIEILY